MTIKSKAAVAYRAAEPLSVEIVNVALPKDNEVLVEIKATGICHTDAYTLSGRDPEGLFSAILGHEGAGEVVAVGKNVTSQTRRSCNSIIYT
ncbi:alcohol dehydrogenase GroES-like domain protein [Francisella tularensis]|uniref:Alcohol dehydrogenase GroES-like domain protein n=2 Tax=Francisella tularensis TaxID=263 RepID=A0AAW3D590_FRATU|nr:alcohol dehydrogenase GroES-like domain protein [Francisella tularensis subsp. tularensis SCHU S4]AJI70832.1 alcohol dehydrogenase GroES-like domain protein [Francisella tularensis subsp. tularensis]AKE20726.1 alcohol dehydrogenase GroES-like domain protein [Francisella tularensis subsp. tularensis str. SCHU S4 substr. NR-28534]EZK38292.1 S-(hydroxymethyl)glutathione dehydrogenase [Francisella tularensis subsp. tularensis str. SCHU S4 substr. FSC237]EZK40301.1 S-(hydroxymethyl)glutathione de